MKKDKKIDKELSAKAVMGQPTSAEELINKYGTYEIQPTADTSNPYPAIAQGFPKKGKGFGLEKR